MKFIYSTIFLGASSIGLLASSCLVFTALLEMQTQSGDENSVRLSKACIVTKRKKNLCRFLHHAKDHFSLVF